MSDLNRRLPWLLALGALALYCVGLSHGVTANSLALTAALAGWDGTPLVGQPLFWLLTLPVRLLPAGWIPVALNLFSAGAASLTLGLLARTVQLLPWDRPWEIAARRAAPLPVLLAGAVCGLEFSFWQSATAATGEMLDLLPLAAGVWLLLEYRLRRQPRWRDAAVVIWGLGMAENWALLLALPLFVAGLVWLEPRRFLERKYVLRLAGLGFAGFAIYALLPLANSLPPHAEWSLGHAWFMSLRQTKNVVVLLYHQFGVAHRLVAVAVAVYFLVPTIACLVRLRDEGTRHKAGADIFQTWLYRGLRAALLLACLWLAFDPVTGPRQIVQKQFGVSLPLLTFDYLNALGAAFLAGNLLLIFLGAAPLEKYPRKPIFWRKLGVPIAVTLLLLFSAGLVARNAAAVLRVNFHPLEHFGELAAQSLPAGCGVMLSDQPSQLAVFQAALAHHRNGSDWLAVDTRALPAVAYRAGLERRQPAGWLTDETRHELTPLEMFLLLDRIARTNRIFYLNPSYGYFFERFYLVPAGAIYELKIRPNSPEIPALPPAAIAANEDFWTRAWPKELAPLVRVRAVPSGWQNRLACYGLTIAPAHTDPLLANWYSLALDGWGVALQRQGRLPAAQLRWEQALQLNPDNFSARISLACNTNLQAGQTLSLANVGEVADQLGNFQRLSLILNNCGPFDEPVFCYLEGGVFQRAGLLLQAREEMERTRRLAPGVPAPEIALADIDNQLRLPDQARALIRHLHLETKNLPENKALEMELARLEANSWLVQTNSANARTVLQSVLQKNPDDTEIADQVLNSFIAMGDYTNALTLVNVRLARSPDDPASLNLQAAILLQSGQATPAIPILDHLLTLTNLPAARLNRALARLAVKDIAAAEADYQELESAGDESAAAYGLAAIADQRHDTNQAVHYLELCLSNTPPGTLLWHEASKHLAALDHSR